MPEKTPTSTHLRPIRIGTRGSKLALAQANWVKGQLESRWPGPVELVVIKTTGDQLEDVPLALVGGKGLFVKEIEQALLGGQVDLGVHSLKDLPSALPPELCLARCRPGRTGGTPLFPINISAWRKFPLGGGWEPGACAVGSNCSTCVPTWKSCR